MNVHKTFRRRLRDLLNVLCTFTLRPVSTRNTGQWLSWMQEVNFIQKQYILNHKKNTKIFVEKLFFPLE